jgi:hypothetical protein
LEVDIADSITDEQVVSRYLEHTAAEMVQLVRMGAGGTGVEGGREEAGEGVGKEGVGKEGGEERGVEERMRAAAVPAEEAMRVAIEARSALISIAVPYVSIDPTSQTRRPSVQGVKFKPAVQQRPPELPLQPPMSMPQMVQHLMEELMQKLTKQPAQAGPLMNKLIKLLQQNPNQRLPPNLQKLLQMLLLSRTQYQQRKEHETRRAQRDGGRDLEEASKTSLSVVSSIGKREEFLLFSSLGASSGTTGAEKQDICSHTPKRPKGQNQRHGKGTKAHDETKEQDPSHTTYIPPIATRARIPSNSQFPNWHTRHSTRLQQPQRGAAPRGNRALGAGAGHFSRVVNRGSGSGNGNGSGRGDGRAVRNMGGTRYHHDHRMQKVVTEETQKVVTEERKAVTEEQKAVTEEQKVVPREARTLNNGYAFKSAGSGRGGSTISFGPQPPKGVLGGRHGKRLVNKQRGHRPLASEESKATKAGVNVGHEGRQKRLKPLTLKLSTNLSPDARKRALDAIPVLLNADQGMAQAGEVARQWVTQTGTVSIRNNDPLLADAQKLQALRTRPEVF